MQVQKQTCDPPDGDVDSGLGGDDDDEGGDDTC